MKKATYRYALDGDSLICIDSLTGSASERKTYKCPVCRQDTIAAMGDVYQWYFRHKGYDESIKSLSEQCPYDTYLRTISRILFSQSYKKRINTQQPVILEYHETEICNCEYEECEKESLKEFDLATKFKVILEPSKSKKKYPDLYLVNDNGVKIHILMLTRKEEVSSELMVSKERIIAFRVPGENSLSRFDSIERISEGDGGTTYHNFNTTKQIDIKQRCKKYHELRNAAEREAQALKEFRERKQKREAIERQEAYLRDYPTSSMQGIYIGPETTLREGYYFSVDFSGKCEFIYVGDYDCLSGKIPDGYSYLKHCKGLNVYKKTPKQFVDCFHGLTSFLKDKPAIKVVDCYLCQYNLLDHNGIIKCPQAEDDHLRALNCPDFKLFFDRYI